MRIIGTAAMAAAIALGATAAQASDSDSVKQTVRTWLQKFNAGDGPGALAMCADHGSIIDEFAPFRWTSFADWFKAYDAYAAQNNITASRVTVNSFAHVNVENGRAYVVAPSTYSFKESGKPHAEAGTQVLSLEKTGKVWRITSSAWFGKNGVDAGSDAAAIGKAVDAFVSMASPPTPPPIAIVDEFAPYHWEGANANADWFAGLQKDNTASGVTDMALKLDAASQLMANGKRAYAVFPTTITSKHHGKANAEHGGFAFTLQKANDAWQIVSWAWATK